MFSKNQVPVNPETILTVEGYGGSILKIDFKPLLEVFKFDNFSDPASIAYRILKVQDNLILYSNEDRINSELIADYEFLRSLRNAFAQMKSLPLL